jgi:hypothetical protein
MTRSEVAKALRKAGVGGFFGTGLELLDRDYTILHFAKLNQMIKTGLDALAIKGFVAERDYEKEIEDCENYAVWLWTEVSQQYVLANRGKGIKKGLAYGWSDTPGHALTCGLCVEGVCVWNYGIYKPDFDIKAIKKIRFM